MRSLRIALVIGVLGASACSSTEGSTAVTLTTVVDVTTTADDVTTTSASPAPLTTEASTTVGAATTQPAVTTLPAGTTAPPTTETPALVDVKVYFLRDERLVIAHRQVPGPAVLRGALTELLAGPTAAELADGLVTAAPNNTDLLDVKIDDGLATVDMSSEFESGGGTLSMTARIAQVVFTATQFDSSDRVAFWLDGEPIEFLGGEGILLEEPQARFNVDRSISGSVIIDTPAYGATVSGTFTVTGEGDVFEAQFPIEVWADGSQIGGIAPVTAGTFGDWADFEATITLDAGSGPIELIAYDEGGCGTDPECPEIIKTVVALTFTG